MVRYERAMTREHATKKRVTTPPVGEILTPAQVAKLIGISSGALRQWRYQGKGPPYLAFSSRCVRYSLPALLEWLQQHWHEPSAVA
jgi:hypothetical protein